MADGRMMERVDAGLDETVFGTSVVDDVWPVLSDMERAVALHLMGVRTKMQIMQHFELSAWVTKKYMRQIRRKMLAHLPAP